MRKYKSFSDIPTQTEYLDVLQATLQRAQFNAKEMHWNVRGSGFKGIHEILDELYSKYDSYVDEIVETRMSNNDSFDSILTSFIINSAISNYSVGECPFAKSLNDMTTILNLCLANQDDLYSDMIGRLTTDMNHYKYMVSSYQKHFQDGTLTDEVVITEEGQALPTQDVIQETLDNSIPTEDLFSQVRVFCETGRQRRAFNELVKSFAESDKYKDISSECINKIKDTCKKIGVNIKNRWFDVVASGNPEGKTILVYLPSHDNSVLDKYVPQITKSVEGKYEFDKWHGGRDSDYITLVYTVKD